jgi:hypothetical protein
MLEIYEQIKGLVANLDDDVHKASGGNRAAGTRVRKAMQELKNMSQTLRVKVLETRDTSDE